MMIKKSIGVKTPRKKGENMDNNDANDTNAFLTARASRLAAIYTPFFSLEKQRQKSEQTGQQTR